MKKIGIKMAGVLPMPIDDPLNGTIRKKKWYRKIAKKFIPTAWREPSQEDPAEERKEVTAEDIEKLIEEQQYEHASLGLIKLEQKTCVSEEPSTQEKDLETLYEKLKAGVFQVIKESLTKTDQDLLRQAAQAVAVQESEDSKFIPDLKTGKRSRPKAWIRTWEESVKMAVEERFKDLPQGETSKEASSIASTIAELEALLKNDLLHVAAHLGPCYPEEFDVCNAYVQHYHQNVMTQIRQIAQFDLGDKDNYLLLCWVQKYPTEILKNPKLAGHIDVSRLESLLPQHVIRPLESDYLLYEIESVKAHMNKALDFEVELLKEGKEPKILGVHYHSELHIDIIQRYASAFQRAARVRSEVEAKLALFLPNELEDFLRRYKKVFGEYMERNKSQHFYRAICITHLNCCLCLREYLICKESRLKESRRLDMLSLLQQLDDAIYDALLQDLFGDLKAQFKKMSQGSSPFSYQTMQNIIRTSEDFMEPFHTLMDEGYKALSGKVHLYLVKEYLTRILKRKVNNKTVQHMQTLAKQICESAELIESFSAFYRSCEDWLKPALPKLAEIIRLQDLNAIQLEVATLVEAYPDIRNKQIEAILSMKGNLSKNEMKLILKTADTVERRVDDKRRLFELIRTP